MRIQSAPCRRRGFNGALHRGAVVLAVVAAFAAPLARAGAGQTDVLDAKALPLGDGRISAQAQKGHVYACSTRFGGGGAQVRGAWISGQTWDATRKIWVQGDVPWPDARFDIRVQGQERVFAGNALPVGHTTGQFPVARTDPAYQIDRNPNAIKTQTLSFTLPLQPSVAVSPSCLPMGVIGVAVNGVPIFNALDAMGRDAEAHEVQDRCHGHPERSGTYHYHGPSDCVPGGRENGALVGYALDGFGIYSRYDDRGREITNADLDECHGRIAPVMWNGQRTTMYHYVMTREYPYTLGCFRGKPVTARVG
jgi:hypothetical protein